MKILLMALSLFSFIASAEAPTPESTVRQLEDMNKELASIYFHGLHVLDQGRITLMKKDVEQSISFIREFGLGHMRTINSFQVIIVRFRYSSQFFDFIRTEDNRFAIEKVLSFVAWIKTSFGIDDDPYTKVLKPNLAQMKEIVDHLLTAPQLDPKLALELAGLKAPIGEAMAISDLGDRPKAFAAAAVVYYKLRTLYSDLQGSMALKAYFASALELIGLNEFIGEYAQTN